MIIYDYIFYSESILQKRVIENILKYKISKNCRILIIYRDPYIPSYSNEFSNLAILKLRYSFHGIKNCVKSLMYRKLSRYICNNLVASFLSGLNSLYLESVIQYKNLILIDDGTETLIHLFFEKKFMNKRIRQIHYIYNIFCSLFNFRKLKTINEIKSCISEYYSIYFNTFDPYTVEHLDLWFDLNLNEKLINKSEYIAFIGQPFVEIGWINKKEYLAILDRITLYFKSNSIIYYLHPAEKMSKFNGYNNININFVRNQEAIELLLIKSDYYAITSISSTALINIKSLTDSKIFYFPFQFNNENQIFYDLFDKFGIKKFDLK
jgi:hypothetical protein